MTKYYLIKRDGKVEQFTHFIDLTLAHFAEYGFYPNLVKAIESGNRNELFYWR